MIKILTYIFYRKNIICKLSGVLKHPLLLLLVILFINACSVLRDQLSGENSSCAASDCHIFTVLKTYPPLSGKHALHLSRDNIFCDNCHSNYNSFLSHKNGTVDGYSTSVNIVSFDSINPSASWNNSTTSCENLSCHTNADWYGTASFGCTGCHYGGSGIDPVLINGNGIEGKHQKHVSDMGIPCEKCHFNYKSMLTHADGSLDTDNSSVLMTYFDTSNPSGSWTGDTGAHTGSCASLACHGTSTLDWYGSNTWVLPACDSCHGAPAGNRRQVTGTGGDFAGNSSILSLHVRGSSDPTDEQCQVCHEMSAHTGGTVRLKNADNGAAIVYDSSDISSLEPFCLSCHDSDGALSGYASGGSADNPFSDGNNLGMPPYPYSKRISVSWNKVNGHGPNGGHGQGDRLTCLGTGEPGTGCHGNNGSINAHGSTWDAISTKEFKYDLPDSYSESYFDLCFNCHAGYPGVTKEDIFGVKPGGVFDWDYGPSGGPNGNNPPYYTGATTTHFADMGDTGSGLFYDDSFWGDQMNLHWSHIGIQASDYRGTGVDSGITCVNCHDVHGTSTVYGMVYSEIGYSNGAGAGPDIYGKMNDGFPGNTSGYPAYCGGFACHDVFTGSMHVWFYPMNE